MENNFRITIYLLEEYVSLFSLDITTFLLTVGRPRDDKKEVIRLKGFGGGRGSGRETEEEDQWPSGIHQTTPGASEVKLTRQGDEEN